MPVRKTTTAQQRARLLARLWALLEKEVTAQETAGEVKSFATLVTILNKLTELQKDEAKTPKLKAEDKDILRRAILKRLEIFTPPQQGDADARPEA